MKQQKNNSQEQIRNLSAVVTRALLGQGLGQSFEGKRDMYKSCGYPQLLTFEQYYGRYRRDGIAKTIVNAFPDMTWKEQPEIYDTEDTDESEFEKRIKELWKTTNMNYYMKKADRMAGVGAYSVLFLGLDDGKELNEPCDRATDVAYVQAFYENNATIQSYETDPKNKRYGKPTSYLLSSGESDKVSASASKFSMSKKVHWTRIIHIADNCEDSDVFGIPRLEPVWNYLENIDKVAGGSAEMFWKGGFPGYTFNMDSDTDLPNQDKESLKDEIEKYMHGLQRYMKLKGVQANSLSPQVADPTSNIDAQLKLIAFTTRIPKRILEGSERGELSSITDKDNWIDRVDERRKTFVDATIVRQTVDRCILVGVLPEPVDGEYEVEWPSLYKADELREADLNIKKIQTLTSYVGSQGAENILPVKAFLVKFMGMKDDEAETMLEEAREDMEEKMAEAIAKQTELGLKPEQPAGETPEEQNTEEENANPEEGDNTDEENPFPVTNEMQNETLKILGGKNSGNHGHTGRPGQVGGAGGGSAYAGKTRSERAKMSHKPVDENKKAVAEHYQQHVANEMQGANTPDRQPFDVLIGNRTAIEVKTIVDQTNDKITMHPPSIKKKKAFMRKNKISDSHTIVVDTRGGKIDAKTGKPAIVGVYYSKGIGSFNLSAMQKVGSMKEAFKLVNKDRKITKKDTDLAHQLIAGTKGAEWKY